MLNKKIIFFLGSMGRGGAEKVISILSKEYAKCGWHTSVALLLENKVDYILDRETRVLDFTGNTTSRIKRIPMWLKKIRNYVKKEKPDVIVTFVARINILVLLACLGLNVKIVVSERNDPKHDGRGLVTKLMTKILYPMANTIIFQTHRVKSQFGLKLRAKSVVIPNPISIIREASQKKEKKIVSVGRLSKQKNQRMLIDAFANVVKIHNEYKLYIYGEGDLRDELTSHINELGLSNSVFLPGNVLNVHEKICDAEFFVLSSDYEGLSNALLEAMMMGLPCIATNCVGSDEYIEDGINGILVPVSDKEEMEKAILDLIENEEKRNIFGKMAKLTSQRFDTQSILNKWHEIID